MGYAHRVVNAKCGHCDHQVVWHGTGSVRFQTRWSCNCGHVNTLALPRDYPNVPQSLYVGPEKYECLKVYAVPPAENRASWAQPYSIRSFVAQASERYAGCHFRSSERGKVLGEIAYSDICYHDDPELPGNPDAWIESPCHLVSGWSTGQTQCPLWISVARLCQTDYERRFLHHYLRYVKDRQFPMLIPQPRIGIAERRRPDFIAFVPLQHWQYRWLAIELDGAHAANSEPDAARDAELAAHGYDVFSVRPAESGYLEEVRRLAERFEELMSLAETDVWRVAVEARVTSTEASDDLPF